MGVGITGKTDNATLICWEAQTHYLLIIAAIRSDGRCHGSDAGQVAIARQHQFVWLRQLAFLRSYV